MFYQILIYIELLFLQSLQLCCCVWLTNNEWGTGMYESAEWVLTECNIICVESLIYNDTEHKLCHMIVELDLLILVVQEIVYKMLGFHKVSSY